MIDAARAAPYQARDQLYLWLLTQPQSPILIGELNLRRSTQGVSLRYAENWLQNGFPLSEDLPLIAEESFCRPTRARQRARSTTRGPIVGASA